ncbi:MAG: hypothetical protein ABI947_18555 [Chloroflexota bacterium]
MSRNPYSYTGGNPVNRTDRSGKCFDPVSLVFCAAIGIGAVFAAGNAYHQFRTYGRVKDWGSVGTSFVEAAGVTVGVGFLALGGLEIAGAVGSAWGVASNVGWAGALELSLPGIGSGAALSSAGGAGALSFYEANPELGDELAAESSIVGENLESTTKTIRLVGFRGIGGNEGAYLNPDWVQEHDLIKAGHVGISFDQGKTIFGFWPSKAAAENAGGSEALVQLLKDGESVLGRVYDDTTIFQRAFEFSQEGASTDVWQMSIEVSPEEFDQIEQTVQNYVGQGENLNPPQMYRWPARDPSPMPSEICNNCST